MIAAEEAWQRIESRLRPTTRTEELARLDALHRVLARDVAATVDEPMADVSAMDGYAMGGTPEEGAVLAVVGVSAAGRPPDFEVGAGQAAKIMTGAVVPAGADRVIPVEQTTPQTTQGEETVRIDSVVEDRRHIRQRGEVIARGEALLPAGRRLGPGALSTLASHGVMRVPVLAAPRVAVLSTGDEVVPPEATPGPGQLRDSNGPFLLAAGRSMGLEFRHLGIAGDARDELAAAIRDGAAGSDVLLLCGGVSMGDYDFVEDVLDELGCETLFDKVAIQPGKPLVAARRPPLADDVGDAGGWIFGLPGNPASVMVTFWLFVRPLIRRWMGHEDGFWHGALEAELAGELPRSKGRDRFVATELAVVDGRLRATPLRAVGSHDSGTYGRGTGLVRIRPNREARPAGGVCQVLPVGVGSLV